VAAPSHLGMRQQGVPGAGRVKIEEKPGSVLGGLQLPLHKARCPREVSEALGMRIGRGDFRRVSLTTLA